MKRFFVISLSVWATTATFGGGAKPPSKPRQEPAPIPDLESRPQVIQGWIEEYSEHIRQEVRLKYPELVNLDSSRMQTICPNWQSLRTSEREEFWPALLWSITGPESARNRTLVYLESSMSKDPVTGYQVRSEGMLQLSYQDIPQYGYPGKDISWARDQQHARYDYDRNSKYGYPNRTILNAYANFNMGLFIMHKRLTKLDTNLNFQDSLGKYWFVMKSQKEPFKEVLKNLKSQIPECFE